MSQEKITKDWEKIYMRLIKGEKLQDILESLDMQDKYKVFKNAKKKSKYKSDGQIKGIRNNG